MFQSRYVKIDDFGSWNLGIFSADAGMQFTSTEFEEKCQTRCVWLTLADPQLQEMNRQLKVTWRTLRTIAHSLMVHSRVSEAYFYFVLIFMEDHILPVLSIKDLINEDRNPTTPYKLETGSKLQYCIHLFYFVRVLCKNPLHMLG